VAVPSYVLGNRFPQHIDAYQPKQAIPVLQGWLLSTLHIVKIFSVTRIEFICRNFVESF